MYKGNSAAMQRYHKVHEIAPRKGYVADDVLPELGRMTLGECIDEKARLMGELSRVQNEIIAAKRRGCVRLIGGLGHRVQSLEKRLGPLNEQIKALRRGNAAAAWRQAIQEICPEHSEAIDLRQREIWAEARSDA